MEHRTNCRIRDIQAAVVALTPPENVRNVRFRTAGARKNYVTFRVEGAGCMKVSKLALRFRNCDFHMGDGGALEVYVPVGIILPVAVLKAASFIAFGVAACAFGLGIWTVHAST